MSSSPTGEIAYLRQQATFKSVKDAHCLFPWVPTVEFELELAGGAPSEGQLLPAGPAHRASEVRACTVTISRKT